MRVDQSRQERLAAAIDDLRALRDGNARAYGGNASIAHQDVRLRRHARAVEHAHIAKHKGVAANKADDRTGTAALKNPNARRALWNDMLCYQLNLAGDLQSETSEDRR